MHPNEGKYTYYYFSCLLEEPISGVTGTWNIAQLGEVW